MKKLWLSILVVLVFAALAAPALAAPATQGSGGIHFGPYTLERGNRISEDLVVFGGPVMLRSDSVFSGDLTVFGPITMEEGALLDGQLVAMGAADVSGQIEGDVFTAGALTLGATAHIRGDVATAGAISRATGAVIEGDVVPVDEGGWRGLWRFPTFEFGDEGPRVGLSSTPRWVSFFLRVIRGFAGVVVLGLLALVVASLWPSHVERVGRAVEEAALTSFGIGLLTLIGTVLGAALLAITICLSPFAVIGLVVVGLGILLGWVALGAVVGRRILTGLLNQPAPNSAVAAVVGTVLLSSLLAVSRIFGVLHTFLVFLLVPPAAGAVLLTRFGTMPYATRGVSGTTGGAARPPQAPAGRANSAVVPTAGPGDISSLAGPSTDVEGTPRAEGEAVESAQEDDSGSHDLPSV
jgi:cytoskeletal protein CcmA (bactofilin family)